MWWVHSIFEFFAISIHRSRRHRSGYVPGTTGRCHSLAARSGGIACSVKSCHRSAPDISFWSIGKLLDCTSIQHSTAISETHGYDQKRTCSNSWGGSFAALRVSVTLILPAACVRSLSGHRRGRRRLLVDLQGSALGTLDPTQVFELRRDTSGTGRDRRDEPALKMRRHQRRHRDSILRLCNLPITSCQLPRQAPLPQRWRLSRLPRHRRLPLRCRVQWHCEPSWRT